ncbi:type IV secretion system protein VirB7 [Bartonella taylorii]|uniref:type IV secretion system protein VirB7 n=1 Tax=Bartonella taylorii TaxID=33046 RepID=UPI001ABB5BA5|nr:type IV secretion system protein VirB7 [Bartonella taylorii]USP01387.1 type IV secretion system protein VirB7 [Bartonella taylorii]
MKRKITFFVILTTVLTGCASLSGPKKPPRCNGKHTRALNRDKWDWDNKNIILQEKIVKPVTTPIILNTLESEKATADVTPHTALLNPINHEALFDKTAEVTREK